MNSDFGISKALENLSRSNVKKVVKYLKDDLGVEDIKDLKKVNENDLTKDKLLKPIQARNLIEYWEQELATNPTNAPGAGGIQQNVKKNTGRDVSRIKFKGKPRIKADSAVFGIGNATTTKNSKGSKRKTNAPRKKAKKQRRSPSSDSDAASDDDSSPSGSDGDKVSVKIGGKSRIDAKSAVFGKGDATATEYNNGGKNVYNVRGDVKGDGAFAGSNKNKNYGTINKNIS